MHLLDIPKPKRSFCLNPNHVGLAVIALLLVSQLVMELVFQANATIERSVVMSAKPIVAQKPVRYITVKTIVYQSPCNLTISETHQMPLTELYDELSTMGERAVFQARKSQIDGSAMPLIEQKKIYSGFQKEFASKYGLTLAKVKMIQKEGCQQTHGTEWCALSFITDILELKGKAFAEKYGHVLKENGEFIPIEEVKSP